MQCNAYWRLLCDRKTRTLDKKKEGKGQGGMYLSWSWYARNWFLFSFFSMLGFLCVGLIGNDVMSGWCLQFVCVLYMQLTKYTYVWGGKGCSGMGKEGM